MEKKMIMNYKKRFDEIRHEENGVEFWYARELMHLLDYSKWQNFENVLLKAKVACANNGIVVEDHFADASKMVILGSGATEILVKNRSVLHKAILQFKQENRN